jgi:hypothetical protein
VKQQEEDEDGKKAKSSIQATQQKVDESAKELTTKNAEYQQRKQELKEKHQMEIDELEVFFDYERISNFLINFFRSKSGNWRKNI